MVLWNVIDKLVRNSSCFFPGMDKQDGRDIRERAFRFACDVAKTVFAERTARGFVITDQLLKASGSVGANLEEAKAASSRREFVRMCEISLREAREAVYWIRICLAVGLLPETAEPLRREGDEIARIVGAIVVNSKRRLLAERAVSGATVVALLWAAATLF